MHLHRGQRLVVQPNQLAAAPSRFPEKRRKHAGSGTSNDGIRDCRSVIDDQARPLKLGPALAQQALVTRSADDRKLGRWFTVLGRDVEPHRHGAHLVTLVSI